MCEDRFKGHDIDDQGRPLERKKCMPLPDASVRWYPGADHDVHVQKPEALTDDLLQLLARVEERDAR